MSAPRAAGHRRWGMRLGAGLIAALLVVTIAEVWVGAGAKPASAAGETIEIQAAHGTSYVPALEGKRPLFILAIGSDARSRALEHGRSDSIHIIGVNLKTHRASILGFPRDSWVNIPGHGSGKITTAMSLGGPSLLVDTLENLTGITIDFWLLTNFGGLRRMVNGIGGLTVDIPIDLDDHFSGAHLSAGSHHIDGWQALSFARDRHDFGTGDFARSENQGTILVAALTKLRTQFSKNPAVLFEWIVLGWKNVTTGLSVDTLLDLALTATLIPADKVTNQVVPGTTGQVGEASVVFISSSARAIYADLRADGVIGS
jgi:polyisoprenyl-teichoic acid--peptidoglycan teichoic acid transferase